MKTICTQLVKIIQIKRRLIDAEMKKFGISRTGWQALLWLENIGPCTQKELLMNMDIDAGHLARVLDEFETKNYITRRPTKADRRCLLVEITDYGQQHIMPIVRETIAKEDAILFQGVSDEEKQSLQQLLSRLEKNLEEAHNEQNNKSCNE